MKQILITIALVAAVLSGASCSKEYISPEDLMQYPSKNAQITNKSDKSVTTFKTAEVYRRSGYEGKSWLTAKSGGKMVEDAFWLSMYFDCVDNLNAGDKIIPDSCRFSFVFSSDSNATTHEYDGNITFIDKGSDFVILHFDKVLFTCSFGEYMIDGYLYCTLKNVRP